MDGRISLKHVGDVEVVGLNLTELADYLKQLYQAVFEDPIVTTTLVQSNSLRYTVMGKVNSPGIFFLDFPLTAVQVIARSGGFTEWANKKMTIVRQDLQDADRHLFTDHTLEFDYDAFVSGDKLDRNIAIRSGDIIIVH
jgi:polysaccharide export outer membrane protein